MSAGLEAPAVGEIQVLRDESTAFDSSLGPELGIVAAREIFLLGGMNIVSEGPAKEWRSAAGDSRRAWLSLDARNRGDGKVLFGRGCGECDCRPNIFGFEGWEIGENVFRSVASRETR
jgi:hypothetical protein